MAAKISEGTTSHGEWKLKSYATRLYLFPLNDNTPEYCSFLATKVGPLDHFFCDLGMSFGILLKVVSYAGHAVRAAAQPAARQRGCTWPTFDAWQLCWLRQAGEQLLWQRRLLRAVKLWYVAVTAGPDEARGC